ERTSARFGAAPERAVCLCGQRRIITLGVEFTWRIVVNSKKCRPRSPITRTRTSCSDAAALQALSISPTIRSEHLSLKPFVAKVRAADQWGGFQPVVSAESTC